MKFLSIILATIISINTMASVERVHNRLQSKPKSPTSFPYNKVDVTFKNLPYSNSMDRMRALVGWKQINIGSEQGYETAQEANIAMKQYKVDLETLNFDIDSIELRHLGWSLGVDFQMEYNREFFIETTGALIAQGYLSIKKQKITKNENYLTGEVEFGYSLSLRVPSEIKK